MIWSNTKLLLKLFYRPLAAMSAIIDEGSWVYGAILVVLISLVLQSVVTSRIYQSYEAVYKPIAQQANVTPESTVPGQTQPAVPAQNFLNEVDYDDYHDFAVGRLPQFERRPLPLVGNHGWWFVSFAPSNFLSAVIGLAVLYIPGVVLLVVLLESVGSFGVVIRRDYGSLLICALMAWAAGHLPFALAGFALDPLHLGARTALVLWCLSAVCFGLFMALAVRTIFGGNFNRALLVISLASLSFAVQARIFSVVSPYLFSPFLLYYAYAMFRGDIGDIGFSLRQRQNFRRSMEAATVNPRDAEAHYQLGLVYRRRRQINEAVARFKQAIGIDWGETDAHFQLGCIARERGHLQEAIDHFSVVIEQDEKHSNHEIWREVGATYVAASMFAEARDALETFVERRAYDPEGLFCYGTCLEGLGQKDQAQEMFRRCVEAVNTMPYYRQGQLRKWRKLAQERVSGRSPVGSLGRVRGLLR
jgi:Tfp pilus assembly protein PilF